MSMSLSRRRLLMSMGLLAVGAVGCSTGPDGRSDGIDLTGSTGSPAPKPSLPTSSPTKSPAEAPSTSSAGAEHPPTEPPSSVPGGPAIEVGHVATIRPHVALTFHGGGAPETARAILDISKFRGVRITVLAIGTWLQANPELAQAILDGWHDLGNHTWSHPVLSDLPEAEVRDEITRCRDLLIRLTGTPGPFFRTSSGQHASDMIARVAGESGYPICLSYDVDSTDWTDPGPDVVRARAAAATAGSIVSLHFGHAGTVQALPGIVDDLQSRGLTAVTASTLLTSP